MMLPGQLRLAHRWATRRPSVTAFHRDRCPGQVSFRTGTGALSRECGKGSNSDYESIGRGYRLATRLGSPGHADDAGAGLLLWGPGAHEERALHHHAQLLHPGVDLSPMGAVGL